MFEHILDDSNTRNVMFKVRILYTRLDGIERSSDGDRGNSARDRGNEVLCPSCFRIVLHVENVFFRPGGSTKELEFENTLKD